MWSQAVARTELSKILATHNWNDIDGLWMQVGCYTASSMQDEAGIADNKKKPCAGEGSNGHRVQMLPADTKVEGSAGNNAGIAGPTGGVEDIKPEDWRRTIDVCLTGQFLCAHFAVPLLKAAGGGSIVNFVVGCGAVRLRVPNTLLGRQVWRCQTDPKPREGARSRQYSCQCDFARHR